MTFESDWSPALDQPLLDALGGGEPEGRLEIGCVAAHGMFGCATNECHVVSLLAKPATAFLFELIALLQSSATVPMIDIRAYARWLAR